MCKLKLLIEAANDKSSLFESLFGGCLYCDIGWLFISVTRCSPSAVVLWSLVRALVRSINFVPNKRVFSTILAPSTIWNVPLSLRIWTTPVLAFSNCLMFLLLVSVDYDRVWSSLMKALANSFENVSTAPISVHSWGFFPPRSSMSPDRGLLIHMWDVSGFTHDDRNTLYPTSNWAMAVSPSILINRKRSTYLLLDALYRIRDSRPEKYAVTLRAPFVFVPAFV